jgi:hypothetical protein
MMQSLHILRKDIEHLQAEISIYAGLLFASAIAIPRAWDPASLANEPLHVFAGLLNYLIPIIWIVVIARLVHDEALVGDTQFWITRPYQWISLLSSKLLFILLCVVLPFALTQWAIVLQAGLNPLHALSGQLQGLLAALMGWLILTVLASITATIQGMFLSIVAALILWAATLTTLGNIEGTRMPLPFGVESSILIGSLLFGILLYQYASRNTFASRFAVGATTLLFLTLFACLMDGAIQAPVDLFVHHHYPLSSNGPLSLVFNPSSIPSEDAGKGKHVLDQQLIVRLPVTMQGVDSTTQLDHQNVSFTIDAPGYHYTSPWRPADLEDETLLLLVPQKALEAAHDDSIHLHLSAVAQRLLPGTPQTVTAAESFSVPGNGMCHLLPSLSGDNVSCRYAFQIASRTVIHAMISPASCLSSGPADPAMETLAERSPMNGPDPTIGILLHLGGSVCPGTPLTFTDYHPAENFRLELDIPSINLNRYLVR